ncbi:MAG: Uncharacterized protein conserved in bacteria, partial [uncultured Chloroflexi bacterium]
ASSHKCPGAGPRTGRVRRPRAARLRKRCPTTGARPAHRPPARGRGSQCDRQATRACGHAVPGLGELGGRRAGRPSGAWRPRQGSVCLPGGPLAALARGGGTRLWPCLVRREPDRSRLDRSGHLHRRCVELGRCASSNSTTAQPVLQAGDARRPAGHNRATAGYRPHRVVPPRVPAGSGACRRPHPDRRATSSAHRRAPRPSGHGAGQHDRRGATLHPHSGPSGGCLAARHSVPAAREL